MAVINTRISVRTAAIQVRTAQTLKSGLSVCAPPSPKVAQQFCRSIRRARPTQAARERVQAQRVPAVPRRPQPTPQELQRQDDLRNRDGTTAPRASRIADAMMLVTPGIPSGAGTLRTPRSTGHAQRAHVIGLPPTRTTRGDPTAPCPAWTSGVAWPDPLLAAIRATRARQQHWSRPRRCGHPGPPSTAPMQRPSKRCRTQFRPRLRR